MRGRFRGVWGAGAVFAAAAVLAGCGHVHNACAPGGDCPPGKHCQAQKVCTDPSLMALGSDLDDLERHIDWYGSVVARIPDVWGQARLTEHRQEFEKQMFDELGNFEATLQGSLARSDQAYFAHATALSFAAQPKSSGGSGGGAPPALVPQSLVVETITETPALFVKGEGIGTSKTTKTETQGVTPATAAPKADAAATPAKATTADDLVKEPVLHRTQVRLPAPVRFDTIGAKGITLEPTLMLAQKKRYLDFLNQLRRENEGDDIADSPGYSLNLVRIPVSLLPGKRTDVGHGAEVSMTLTPILGDDLLPTTFRTLVANDLRHQLGLPLTQFLNDDKEAESYLKPEYRLGIQGLAYFNDLVTAAKADRLPDAVKYLIKIDAEEPGVIRRVKAVRVFMAPADAEKIDKLFAEGTAPKEAVETDSPTATQKGYSTAQVRFANDIATKPNPLADGGLRSISVKLAVPALDFSPGLVNKTGFPTSQLLEVYGLSHCFQIAFAAHDALHDTIARQKYAHLPDVQGFLQQETIAAYRFLAEHTAAHLWTNYCNQHTVTAVRLRQADELERLRAQFRNDFRLLTKGTPAGRTDRPYIESGEYSTTAALAWCILVDSALLTDKLMRDMGETATAKNAPVPGHGAFLDYYHPCPSPEARQAFNAYAALRWPVRVFALDPVTQDQNIADAYSGRREMQLALSIAFTQGLINANTMTRYARRLELETETVALNRTQVGFGHGENTFGWRFYPRFQTPETESNFTVLFRDQLIGGPSRNALLRDRRLEPGQRECVAVVMMPSFVPFMTLDTVGNWFGLANPKHKVMDHTQALKMSRTVQTLKTCGPNVTDAACYREGEFERMLRRLGQLEARLPSQTSRFPVPVLNTLGGFEMFNNGTTDLAPELYGWYGAPGVKAGATTTLFLVGDHFSPLHTKVIVGNKPADRKLLSRQVMQVDVPGDAVQLNAKHVTAHLATPYGVSRELLIPVVGNPPVVAPGFTIGDKKLVANYCMAGVTDRPALFHPVPAKSSPGTKDLSIGWVSPGGVLTGQVTVKFEFLYPVGNVSVKIHGEVVGDMTGRELVIPVKELDRLTCELVSQIGRITPELARDPNPLATPLVSTKVQITPAVPPGQGFVAQPILANDAIRLEFQPVVCPPDAPCAPGVIGPLPAHVPVVIPGAQGTAPPAGPPGVTGVTPLPRPTPLPDPAPVPRTTPGTDRR